MERYPVSRKHRAEIQFFERIERSDPRVEHRVAHVSKLGFHEVPGAHDSLFRQIYNRVTLRVAAPEEEKPDFTLALIERHFRGIRHGGWSWLKHLELFPIRLFRRELRLECSPPRRVLFVANLFFECFDLYRHVRQRRLERLSMDHIEIGNDMVDVFVADDLDLGPEDGVTVRVVPVKVW